MVTTAMRMSLKQYFWLPSVADNFQNRESMKNGPFAASSHMVHAGGQAADWDIQNKENSNLSWRSRFVLDVPVGSLLSSMYHVTASCKRPILTGQ